MWRTYEVHRHGAQGAPTVRLRRSLRVALGILIVTGSFIAPALRPPVVLANTGIGPTLDVGMTSPVNGGNTVALGTAFDVTVTETAPGANAWYGFNTSLLYDPTRVTLGSITSPFNVGFSCGAAITDLADKMGGLIPAPLVGGILGCTATGSSFAPASTANQVLAVYHFTALSTAGPTSVHLLESGEILLQQFASYTVDNDTLDYQTNPYTCTSALGTVPGGTANALCPIVSPYSSNSLLVNIVPPVDLSIAKTGPSSVVAGQPASFSLAVTNLSSSYGATGVTVNDTLPPAFLGGSVTFAGAGASSCAFASGNVVCAVGALAAGATFSVSINTTTTILAGNTSPTNCAAVTLNEFDPNTANNTACVMVPILAAGATSTPTRAPTATAIPPTPTGTATPVGGVPPTIDVSMITPINSTNTVPLGANFDVAVRITGGSMPFPAFNAAVVYDTSRVTLNSVTSPWVAGFSCAAAPTLVNDGFNGAFEGPSSLSAPVGASDGTIPLVSAATFGAPGIAEIDAEVIAYSGIVGNSLTGVSRGAYGTTAAAHAVGAAVGTSARGAVLGCATTGSDAPAGATGTLAVYHFTATGVGPTGVHVMEASELPAGALRNSFTTYTLDDSFGLEPNTYTCTSALGTIPGTATNALCPNIAAPGVVPSPFNTLAVNIICCAAIDITANPVNGTGNTVPQGSPFDVTVSVPAGGAAFSAFNTSVVYDPAAVTLNSITSPWNQGFSCAAAPTVTNSTFGGGLLTLVPPLAGGILGCASTGTPAPAGATGILAVYHFTATTAGATAVHLTEVGDLPPGPAQAAFASYTLDVDGLTLQNNSFSCTTPLGTVPATVANALCPIIAPSPFNSVALTIIPSSYATPIPASTGGSLSTVPQDNTVLTVPAGSLATDTTITLDLQPPPVPPPSGSAALRTAYEFGPSGTTFSPCAEAVFHYQASDVPVGEDPSQLRVYVYDSTIPGWVLQGGVVNTTDQSITVPICHFSTYEVLAPPNPNGDADADGYTNAQEIAMGKDPFTYCPAMRADVAGLPTGSDGAVDTPDMAMLGKNFGKLVAPAGPVNPRLDQGPPGSNQRDGAINTPDMAYVGKHFGQVVSLVCP